MGRLLAGNAPEDCADQHTEPGKIAFAQDVPGHDFSSGKDIARRMSIG
jgi:hypothetical protein